MSFAAENITIVFHDPAFSYNVSTTDKYVNVDLSAFSVKVDHYQAKGMAFSWDVTGDGTIE